MSWTWVTVALTVPIVAALVVASLIWLTGAFMTGNIVGTGVVVGGAIALVLREYFELQRRTATCLAAGIVCSIHPSPFTRFAIYGFIAMFEIALIFAISLVIEERLRNRGVAREWR